MTKETLREEWNKIDQLEFVNTVTGNISYRQIANWWLQKLDEYCDEKLEKAARNIDGHGFIDPSQAGGFKMHADGYNEGMLDAASLVRSEKSKEV